MWIFFGRNWKILDKIFAVIYRENKIYLSAIFGKFITITSFVYKHYFNIIYVCKYNFDILLF